MAVATFDTELEYAHFCKLAPLVLSGEYEIFYCTGNSVLNSLPPYKAQFEGASGPSFVVFVGFTGVGE
jgi:hypothetical protein